MKTRKPTVLYQLGLKSGSQPQLRLHVKSELHDVSLRSHLLIRE